MTTPIVTEIVGRLLAVERDDFIDQFTRTAVVVQLPVGRPVTAPGLRTAA